MCLLFGKNKRIPDCDYEILFMPNLLISYKTKILVKNGQFLCLLLFAPFLISNNCYAEEQNTHYKLGIFPHLSESHIEKAYTAIAKDLSEHTSKRIKFDVDDNFENFSSNLEQGKYDIVLVQPFDYVNIVKKLAYHPLASQKKALRAIIVVRKHSPLRTLNNLLGRDLYLPPRSTAISYLTKHHLTNAKFDLEKDINITHESTHISCLLKVIIRIADACATAPEAVELFEEKLPVKFRVLNQTNPIPHVLFAAHPRVTSEDRAALKKQMVSWENSVSGQELLKESRMRGLRIIDDQQYDVVRRIKQEVERY